MGFYACRQTPAHTDTPTANNTQNEQHSAMLLFVAYLLGRLQRTECQLHFTDFFCLGYLSIFHSYASFIHRAVDSYAHIKEIDWFDKRKNKRKLCLTKLFQILRLKINEVMERLIYQTR